MSKLGPVASNILTSAHSASIAVASTATVYSASFTLAEFNALKYKATSDGNVKLQIDIEVGTERPGTEGSADANWAIPASGGSIESSLSDENTHIAALNIPSVRYGRLKITGLGAPNANDASTVVTAEISRQENW